MKEKILTNTIKQHLDGKKKGVADDWCWTGFAVLITLFTFFSTWKWGINLADGSTSIATGMFALMSIGASSVLASTPRFLVIDLKNVSAEAANENLKYFVSVQWVNLKALMISAVGTLIIAILNSAIGDFNHLNQLQGYVSAILPGLVLIAIRRWWLLTTELLTMVLIYIEGRFSNGDDL